MITFRKILFALFVLIYIVVCPLLVMHSLGIIFKPTTQSIERTGVIYLSTIPSDAKVYINRKFFDDTTPALIAGLLPGHYHLRLVKKGFKEWHKFLPVEEQKSTSLEHILLIPENWPKETRGEEFTELIPLQGSPYLLLKKGPLLRDVVILPEDTTAKPKATADTPSAPDNAVALLPESNALESAVVSDFTTVDESPYILVQAKLDHRRHYLLANLNANPPELRDISEWITADSRDIRWPRDHPGRLYFLNDNSLHYVDLEAGTSAPILSAVQSFAVYNDYLFVLTAENILKRFNFEGKDEEIILNDPEIIKRLFEPYKSVDIRLYKNNLMVFLTEKGSLLMNQLPHIFVEEGIRGYDYRQEDRRFVFWDRRDIGTIDINIGSNETLFQIGPQIRWLGLKEDDIQEAFFVNNGQNILFRNTDTVFLTETENYGQPVVSEITRIKKNSAIAYNSSEDTVFYLEEHSGNLSKIKLGTRSFSLPLTDLSQRR